MLPDVKLHHLRYFVLVAELGSYRDAAERAARTQPAVSLAIRELEHRLGARLFERGKKVELTPFGAQSFPQAKALLEHHTRMVSQMTLAAERRTGRVAIASVPSFAGQILPSILGDFTALHPDVQISVEDDSARNVQQRVTERRVDFGIASIWNPDPNLRFEPLFKDQMGLVCRRDHPLARLEQELEWADLDGHTLIANGTVRLLDGTVAQKVMAGAQFTVSNMTSLLAILRAGLGVTSLPRLALPNDDSELSFFALGEPSVEREVGILTPHRHTLAPAAEALRETILAHAGSTAGEVLGPLGAAESVWPV